VEWLKVQALNSNQRAKKKKERKENEIGAEFSYHISMYLGLPHPTPISSAKLGYASLIQGRSVDLRKKKAFP
jgi:hypothetical protein